MDTANEATITIATDSNLTDEMISKAEIIFGGPRQDVLKRAKNLKWLQLYSAGADGYTDSDHLYMSKDILLTTSSGVYGRAISEHVLAMILSYNRNLQDYALLKQEKRWSSIYKTRDFYGSTVGIIGFGDIGNEVALRAKALGARVLVVKRILSKKPDYVDEIYLTEEIDEVLGRSDYIVLTLPATEKTKGIISKERIGIMKPDAFLVNIGRGELIDQEALIEALRNNRIGGAGLDVMTPEPLPADNPLWELPNVIITQHSSGLSVGNDTRRVNLFTDNLRRYLNNEALENIVNFTEGY
ncbi:MAG: D-2-hydroxyacid dehydrogenase [Clostridiales bacterium]|nr:D-2-hydroxyacid dehydrogenase [Clostridiales bacterium]